MHSKVIAYVPSASVKDVLTQLDVDGRRAKWIAKLIEFNIELKPTKLIKGQGLAQLMAEENCKMLDINCMGTSSDVGQTGEATVEQGQNQRLVENLASCEWYSRIAHFLLKLEVPSGLSSSKARTIKLKASKFCINKNLLYWRDPVGILFKMSRQRVICGSHAPVPFWHLWRASLLEDHSPQDLESWVLLAHPIL